MWRHRRVHVCEQDPRFGEYYQKKRAITYEASSASSTSNRARKAKTSNYDRRREKAIPLASTLVKQEERLKQALAKEEEKAKLKQAEKAKRKQSESTSECASEEPKRKRRKKVTDYDRMLTEAKSIAGNTGTRASRRSQVNLVNL